MRENILKLYEYEKQEIDRWFTNSSRDKIMDNNRNDAIECIFCIGKAYMLALILDKDFGEDTKEERLSMQKVKDYLQFDVLGKLVEV